MKNLIIALALIALFLYAGFTTGYYAADDGIPTCDETSASICQYEKDTPLDDDSIAHANNVARAGDYVVNCDSYIVWCDDEGL
jgi:hypothetical protein